MSFFEVKSNKPIIIITGGDGGFGNLGDEWLLNSTLKRYGILTKEYKVIVLKANPPKYSFGKFCYAIDSPVEFNKLNLDISNIRAVHYYGGGYLNSYWMKDKLWLYEKLVEDGFSKDRFFFTGQGLNPLSKNELNIVKQISKESGYFGTRDRLLEKQINSKFTFDESVSFKNKNYKNKKSNEIWVNFRIANHVELNLVILKKLLKDINKFAKKNGYEIIYFPMIKSRWFDERKEMIKFLSDCGLESKVIDRPKNSQDLLKKISRASIVITSSYHATLASLYNHTPVMAIYENEYYRNKYEGLKKVFATDLLNIHDLNKIDQVVDYSNIINVKDSRITSIIDELRSINNKEHDLIREKINDLK